MIAEIETLPPHLVAVREAFFNWQELGYKNAWEAVYETAHKQEPAPVRVDAQEEKR